MASVILTTIAAKKTTEKELVDFLKTAQKEYDNGTPIISDKHFDALLEILNTRFPKNEWLAIPVKRDGHTTGSKVKLPYYLPSLDKINIGRDEITHDLTNTFTARVLKTYPDAKNVDYIISEKLDGMTGLYCNGNTLFTQGEDGVVGRALTHHMMHLQTKGRLPVGSILTDTCVRGEFIMSRTTFASYNRTAIASGEQSFATARNFVNGIINKIDAPASKVGLIEFVAYEVLRPEGLTPIEQFSLLEKLGFTVAKYKVMKRPYLTDKNMKVEYDTIRKVSKYECDGIVLTANFAAPRPSIGENPKSSIAFKIKGIGEETVVTSIEWNISKHGILIPTVLVEPIVIDGVKISRATGFHAKFILLNKLGPGAIVRIIRSGDVIPKIEEVVRGTDAVMPPEDTWEWEEGEKPVHAIQKDLEESDDFHVMRLTTFFTKIETVGVSEGIVRKLFDGGLIDLPSLLSATPEIIREIPGFQVTSSKKIVANIAKAIVSATRLQLMVASCVFGRGMGETKLALILANYPDLDVIMKRSTWTKEDMPRGISLDTFNEFRDNIPIYKSWLNEIREFLSTEQGWKEETTTTVVTGGKLDGKSIVFTGFRNAELEKAIIAAGGKVGSSVSKKTFVVIAKDPTAETGKVADAKTADVPVMTLEQFQKTYKV